MTPVFMTGPGAPDSPDVDQLAKLWRSGRRAVLMSTYEEAEAASVVAEAARRRGVELIAWSRTGGIHDPRVQSGGGGESPASGFDIAATTAPEVALAGLAAEAVRAEPRVFVVFDLAAHLDDAAVARGLRDLLASLALGRSTLVLIDRASRLPAWAESHLTRFELSLPDRAELESIAKAALRDVDRAGGLEIDIQRRSWDAIVRALAGLSRRQARQLMQEAVAGDRKLTDDDVERVIEAKRALVSGDGLLEFVKAPTSLDELGGLDGLKAWLAARARGFDDDAAEWGLNPPRGVLLLGVQGAGKSLCAKAIATAWRRPLLRLDAGALYDKYIGESERRLRDALHQAERTAPVILWIDEIEKAFAGAGSNSNDGGLSKRMFGALLTWMQEHREPVFLVATANDISALPPELMRKGRFDEIFFVDLPGEEARRAIVRIHLERRGRDTSAFDIDAIVRAAEGYSGAEIEQGIIGALHAAFAERRDLATEDVVRALAESPPLSVTMREEVERLRAWAKGRCVPAG